MSKPHSIFPHIAGTWASARLFDHGLGASLLTFQLLSLFISSCPWSQVLTLPITHKPVFYSCITWNSSNRLLVFAKSDIILPNSFLLPSGVMEVFTINTTSRVVLKMGNISVFCILKKYAIALTVPTLCLALTQAVGVLQWKKQTRIAALVGLIL